MPSTEHLNKHSNKDTGRKVISTDFIQLKPVFKSIKTKLSASPKHDAKAAKPTKKPFKLFAKRGTKKRVKSDFIKCSNHQCKQKFTNHQQMIRHVNHECWHTRLICLNPNCELFDIPRMYFAAHQQICHSVLSIEDLSASKSGGLTASEQTSELCSDDKLNPKRNFRTKLLAYTVNPLLNNWLHRKKVEEDSLLVTSSELELKEKQKLKKLNKIFEKQSKQSRRIETFKKELNVNVESKSLNRRVSESDRSVISKQSTDEVKCSVDQTVPGVKRKSSSSKKKISKNCIIS